MGTETGATPERQQDKAPRAHNPPFGGIKCETTFSWDSKSGSARPSAEKGQEKASVYRRESRLFEVGCIIPE